jgi:hypothetical protein
MQNEKMIGPKLKKMAPRLVCEDCEKLVIEKFGDNNKFYYPRIYSIFYCVHESLENGDREHLRQYPFTPDWCPVLCAKSKKLKSM